jgi:hypothetical protein
VAWLNRLMKCIVIGLLTFEIDLICQFIYTLGQVQKRGVVKSANEMYYYWFVHGLLKLIIYNLSIHIYFDNLTSS